MNSPASSLIVMGREYGVVNAFIQYIYIYIYIGDICFFTKTNVEEHKTCSRQSV
jgi:hypothetical protein